VEKFPGASEGDPPRFGKDLSTEERKAKLTERIKAYAQRVYKRVTSKPETDTCIAGICQRENGFYIDTVLSFRDRRYEYKGLVKKWKGRLRDASDEVRL
jgi:DNA polymerase epsilon subunit 1